MKTEYENKSLLLNVDLQNKKKGSVVSIKCQKNVIKKPLEQKEGCEQKFIEEESYTPVDRYWRDRLKDSKIDNCVQFYDSENN